MFRSTIEAAVRDALQAIGAGGVVFIVERPADMAHGDYSTNAAMIARVDARELTAQLHIEGVERIEVVGKFINFFLSHETIVSYKQDIPQIYEGKKVLVEYTSPNLFKPLHIGNLIGNILGESVSRLLEATGADVKRLNYPSDIGMTIAKSVWGLQELELNPEDIAELGKAYVAGNDAYESGEAKEKIEEINRALYENSNAELSALRKRGIATSLRHLHQLCERLGTKKFDKEIFESESGPVGQNIVKEHVGDVFEESEGAVVYKGEQTRVFLTSQGLPTYEAKEVGLFELKTKAYPDFDISITVTGKEQQDFFRVVFDAVRKLFPDKTAGKTLAHIPTSFLRLTTGKMSSRLGNVITGESLLEDLTRATRGREDVAVGAIKYTVLKSGSTKDILFDPEKSLSLDGDSGPYLQYAHTRALSLIKAAKEASIIAEKPLSPAAGRKGDASESGFSARTTLERTLLHFPEVIERAAKELEPHYVTTYLTELASAFNSWYASERVIVDGKVSSHALGLVAAVEQTLAKGLQVLGIPAPEEM
ncbi:MAG: arginine--tRNA ligase [bacterium]|nr:arginine--tRNA ligase [bacterium]